MLSYDRNLTIFSAMLYSVVVLIAVGLHHHLRDKDDKIKRIPQVIIGLLIIALEIGKQIRNFTGYNYGSLLGYLQSDFGGGDNYAYPFHFCSFFFFWQIISLFTKGKVRQFFENLTYFWSVMIALFIFLMPDSIYGGALRDLVEYKETGVNPLVNSHSLVFHALCLMYFANEIALKRTTLKVKNFWQGAVAFAIFACFAIPAAFIFEANYCSVLSPQVPIPWFGPAHAQGYAIYEPVLVASGMALGILVYLAVCGIRKLESMIKDTTWVEIGFLIFAALLFPITVLLNPEKVNGPTWFLVCIGLLILSMVPAIVRRIILNKKAK